MRRQILLTAVFLLGVLTVLVNAQTVLTETRQPLDSFTVAVSPAGFVPVGTDADLFSFGGGANASFSWRLSSVPSLTAGGGAGYLFLPGAIPDSSVSAGHISLLAGLNHQFSRRFSARFTGEAGWFFAALNGGGAPPGSNPFGGGILSFGYDPSKSLGLGVDLGYRSYAGLSSGVSFGLFLKFKSESKSGTSSPALQLPGIKLLKGDGNGIDPVAISLNTVFPVFYAYYDTNPIGKVYLKNMESVEAKDIVVKVLVKQFMDEAKTSLSIDRLASGATVGIDVIGLFSDRLLSTAEGTKVPLSVAIEYKQYGSVVREEFVETISIGDRNALVWDDDRKAAAFVSSKDPESLRLSRLISTSINDAVLPGLNPSLQKAMAVHETMRLLKLNYQIDPSSAITTGNRTSVDFLQFPQQTLSFRSGDCDDLTILYASVFESLGIPAAFVTLPGHILVAIDLGMSRADAEKIFQKPGDLIESGGTMWLPIETTVQNKDFIFSWEEGARQWRSGVAKNGAALIPVREAWKTYPAVVLPGNPVQSTMPQPKAIVSGFEAATLVLVSRETDARVAALQAEAKKSGDPAVLNRLGVLLARFGQMDRAEVQFTASIKKKETPSALNNLGNLAFTRGRYAESLSWYQKAFKLNGNEPKYLVSIARAQAELGKLEDAGRSFEKVKNMAPDVAEQYAYLGLSSSQIGRASATDDIRRKIEWTE